MGLLLKYATEKVCVVRSLKVALFVGSVLVVINHFDSILAGSVSVSIMAQILVTYAVPYSVATYGSAMQARRMELERRRKPA